MSQDDSQIAKVKLNHEAAQASWGELERHFAAGMMVSVHPQLDLIEVGYQLSQDNKLRVEQWLSTGDIHPVSDEEAIRWHEKNTSLWTLVIKPWVLVQDRE